MSAEKVLAGSGMDPVGEDSAAPRQGANDPDAGWKGGRPKGALGFLLGFYREPEDHKRTSPPGLFPRHPPFEGMLKPAFISQRQDEEPPNIWDTSGISGNVFAHPQASSSAPHP